MHNHYDEHLKTLPPHLAAYKRFLPKHLRFLASTRFQILCVLATAILFLGMLYGPIRKFNGREALPDVIRLEHAGIPKDAARIDAGLFIREIPLFDELGKEFIFDGMVWFEFDKDKISLEKISAFSFDRGTILQRWDPEIKEKKGRMFVRYPVRVKFQSALDHTLFPLNDHKIFIVLTNHSISSDEAVFFSDSDNFNMACCQKPQGWKPREQRVHSGITRSMLEESDPSKKVKTPRVIFQIDFEKPGLRKVLLIMIPLFVVFLLGLFSLVLDPITQARAMISLSMGSITGLLAYRFVIERLSPSVGYLTLTDHMYTLILIATFLVFLLNLYSVVRASRSHWVRLLKDCSFILIQACVLAAWYYLLYHWLV